MSTVTSSADPSLGKASTQAKAAAELLTLAEQLCAASPDVRVVCTPDGRLLAHRRSAPAASQALAAIEVAAFIARHAATLLAGGQATAGTLTPTATQHKPVAYSGRPVTLSGHKLHLIELTTLQPPLTDETGDDDEAGAAALLDAADLPELLPAEVEREAQRLSTVVSLDGTYRAVNSVMERLLRLPTDGLVGRTVAQVLHLSDQEIQTFEQALKLCARGVPQHLTWWYRTPHRAVPITADVTLRAVRFDGEVAVHTLTRLLTDPRDPIHAAHLRNSQLELANFLLSSANRFQQPVKLLEFVLQQLLAKSPAVGGALYVYNEAAHRLDQLTVRGTDHPAGLPARLTLNASAATVARLSRRKMRVAGRILATEFALAGAPETSLAVLPVCSDEALRYVLALTLPAAASLQHGWVTGLLSLISDGLNSVLTRERLRAELASTAERYQVLFNSSADGILLTDGRRVLEANETAAELLGYSPA